MIFCNLSKNIPVQTSFMTSKNSVYCNFYHLGHMPEKKSIPKITTPVKKRYFPGTNNFPFKPAYA